MPKKQYLLNINFLRQLLIAADDILHFGVAVVLLVCAGMILGKTIPHLFAPDSKALLHVLNDVLLALIVMELMWPVLRFLKRRPFNIKPFLYIGIISSTRRILLVEAEHSMTARLAHNSIEWASLWPVLVELGVYVGIILMLAIALRVLFPKGACGESN